MAMGNMRGRMSGVRGTGGSTPRGPPHKGFPSEGLGSGCKDKGTPAPPGPTAQPLLVNGVSRRLHCFAAGGVTVGLAICEFYLETRPDSPGEPGMQPRDPCLPWRGILGPGHTPR